MILPILVLLVFHLQPILHFAFMSFLPGRDTQDLLHFNDYSAVYDNLLPFLIPWMHVAEYFLSTIAFIGWRHLSYMWILFQFLCVIILRQGLPPKLQSFTRKHGRWKHFRFFPTQFLLLSSVAVQGSHVAHALQFPPGRVLRHNPSFFSHLDRLSAIDVTPPSHTSLLNLAVDPSCPTDNLFYPEFFESLPFEEFDDQGELSPSLLHLSGFGREWMDLMFRESSQFPDISDTFTDDASVVTSADDTCSTTSAPSMSQSSEFSLDDILCFSRLDSFSGLAPDVAQLLRSHLHSIAPSGSISLQTAANAALSSMPPDFGDTKLLLRSVAGSSPDESAPENDGRIFPVLVDTGCSVATTGYLEDFPAGTMVQADFGHIKTASGLAPIKGFGMARWRTINSDGYPAIVRVPCYYAPDVKMRLFSPQDYARYHDMPVAEPSMEGTHAWFQFKCLIDDEVKEQVPPFKPGEVHVIDTHSDPQSRLFFFHCVRGDNVPLQTSPATKSAIPPSQCSCGSNSTFCPNGLVSSTTETCQSCAMSGVLNPKNANISRPQKRLLLDHFRFGHVSMKLIQSLYQEPDDESTGFLDSVAKSCPPCIEPTLQGQLACQHPKCETCEIARARRRSTGNKRASPNDPILRVDDLDPGDCCSVDQYESSVRGRLPHTRGREGTKSRYCGGTLFYDHASSKIFVRHQTTLSGAETVEAKRSVDREALGSGVFFKEFHTDNGVFKSRAFEEALLHDEQFIKKSGVGAKHQNSVAERAIGIVQNMARAMLLHVRLHWPAEFDASLWPFALDYAAWIYNHIPRADKAHMCPDELFSKTKLGCWALRRCRVFGCPSFVLDNRLQDGKKIPKWEPRARTGMFLGFSNEHSSTVGLILNLKTGAISPQFHIVYDELFTTVSTEFDIDLEENWIDLWKHSREFYLEDWDPSIDGELPPLDPDFDNSDSDSDDDDNDLPFDPPDRGTMDHWQLPPA